MADDTTRRRFLTATGSAAVLALAGCESSDNNTNPSGTGGGNGTMDETPMGNSSMTETPMDEETPTDDEMMSGSTTFEVVVENVASGTTVQTSSGGVPGVLSPGAFAAHTGDISLFTPGEPASAGLEQVAEDGTPMALAEALAGGDAVLDGGAFASPDGQSDPGPLTPGNTYSFEVTASPDADARLSFATMFVQSNDLFYAPDPDGIPLFQEGSPIDRDVTDEVVLWDAGTEVNEPPGEGPNQAPRQSETDTGTPEGVVREVNDAYKYPATGDVVNLSLSVDNQSGTMATFTATIENVSTPSTLETSSGSVPVPLSPGAFAAHTSEINLFTPGKPASDGLEQIAEDGMPMTLAQTLAGVDAVLDGGAFASPDGQSGPGPLTPGNTYSFQFSADSSADPRLSLATMFIQSNDLFYAPDPAGIPLFNGDDPVEGSMTSRLTLWDAGTEVNEAPGEGPNQAPRQSATDTGTPEGVVRRVMDGYDYPDTAEMLAVTVAPK